MLDWMFFYCILLFIAFCIPNTSTVLLLHTFFNKENEEKNNTSQIDETNTGKKGIKPYFLNTLNKIKKIDLLTHNKLNKANFYTILGVSLSSLAITVLSYIICRIIYIIPTLFMYYQIICLGGLLYFAMSMMTKNKQSYIKQEILKYKNENTTLKLDALFNGFWFSISDIKNIWLLIVITSQFFGYVDNFFQSILFMTIPSIVCLVVYTFIFIMFSIFNISNLYIKTINGFTNVFCLLIIAYSALNIKNILK